MSKKKPVQDPTVNQRVPRLIDDDPCLLKARPDEPVFIVLGRDPAAVATLSTWVKERIWLIENGLLPSTQEERDHIQQVQAKIGQMRDYQPKSFGKRD